MFLFNRHKAKGSRLKLLEELMNDEEPKKVSDLLGLIQGIFLADEVGFFKHRVNGDYQVIKVEKSKANKKSTEQIIREWNRSRDLKHRHFVNHLPVIKTSESYRFRFRPFPFSKRVDLIIPIYYEELYHINSSLLGYIVVRKYVIRLSAFYRDMLHTVHRAITIYNSKYMLLKQFEDEIKFHSEIANSIDNNIDDLLESFLKRVCKIMSARLVSLWVYNDLDNTLALRSFYPSKIDGREITFNSFDKRILDCEKNLAGKALSTQQPVVFMDLQSNPEFANPNFARKYNLSWFIAFPIIIRQKNVASLIVCPSLSEIKISDSKLGGMNKFVSQLASVIKLSNLFFEEDLLYDYDEFLNIMLEFQDEKKFWDNLAVLVRNKMSCEACSIFLVSRNKSLMLKGSTGIVGHPRYKDVVYRSDEPSLTYFAFCQEEPVIYYPELREKFADSHKSKFREELQTEGRSKSLIFMKFLDANGEAIGIIRCNNKKELPAKHIGKFTTEDILQLRKIAHVISNIYSKATSIREKDEERERNLNSLYHEILAPVDGISSHIEWMEKFYFSGTGKEKRVALKFDDMKQNAKLIDMLVASLGNFEEHQISISEIYLPQHLQQCKSFIYSEAFRRKMDVNIGFIEPKIEADNLLMMRVFYNLMRNAVKYYDKKEYSPHLKITSESGKNYVKILFTDNGIGIPIGEEERIFRKFIRGSNSSKYFPEGTGLGLSFCKSILEKHNGSIRVLNCAKPTVFEIQLPKKYRIVS